MAATFPTLTDAVTGETYKPSILGFSRKLASDPTQRTDLKSGRKVNFHEQDNLPYVFEAVFRSIPTANKDAILTFESGTVYWNTLPFNWVDETDSNTYIVMFVKPVECRYTDELSGRWDVLLTMEVTQDNY